MVKRQLFSEQLRRAIETSDKTRYRISQEAAIAQSILSRFVNEGAGLSMESVDKLCACLGLWLVADGPTEKRKGR